jgi:hypothetical protein
LPKLEPPAFECKEVVVQSLVRLAALEIPKWPVASAEQVSNTMQQSDAESKTSPKRPYRRPEIISRERLEAVAVVCTDATSKADPYACPSGPLNS